MSSITGAASVVGGGGAGTRRRAQVLDSDRVFSRSSASFMRVCIGGFVSISIGRVSIYGLAWLGVFGDANGWIELNRTLQPPHLHLLTHRLHYRHITVPRIPLRRQEMARRTRHHPRITKRSLVEPGSTMMVMTETDLP